MFGTGEALFLPVRNHLSKEDSITANQEMNRKRKGWRRGL